MYTHTHIRRYRRKRVQAQAHGYRFELLLNVTTATRFAHILFCSVLFYAIQILFSSSHRSSTITMGCVASLCVGLSYTRTTMTLCIKIAYMENWSSILLYMKFNVLHTLHAKGIETFKRTEVKCVSCTVGLGKSQGCLLSK